MTDPVAIKDATDTSVNVAADQVATWGRVQVVKLMVGADGAGDLASSGAPLPVSGPLTDAQLRASAVPSRVASFSYPLSTGNSSTAQLAAGASFNGAIETPQDQPSVSLLLTSDQPITLTVRQFIDVAGSFAAPDIVFYIPAGTGFARSFPVNGNYVQVIATNTGAATTTTFNLSTAFGVLDNTDAQGAHPVTELPMVLTGAAAQTAVVNNILTPTSGAAGLNVAGYRSASVQVVSTGTGGTFIFEQSNDGTNWIALPVFNAALVTAVPITAAITATASQIVYTFALRCTFVRLRIVTTITGGSIRAWSRISTETWTPSVQLVASNTAANNLAQVSGSLTSAGTTTATPATPTANILNSAASTNGTVVKGSAGTLYSIVASNTNAAVRYLKLHNSATVTVGTTAVALTIAIPAGGTVTLEFGALGMRFGTGICLSTTTGAGDTDTGAVAAGEVKVLTSYI